MYENRAFSPTCKFTGKKRSGDIRKEFNSHMTALVHQHGRSLIVLKHQYGCRENPLVDDENCNKKLG